MGWRSRDAARRLALAAVVGGMACASRALAASATWNLNSNGNWSTPGNWLGGVPIAEGDSALLGTVITANRIVTVNGAFTLGRLTLDDNNSYTVSGASPNALTFDGTKNANAILSVVNGTHTVATPITLASALDVVNATFSTLTFSGAISGTLPLSLSGPMLLSGTNTAFQGETLFLPRGNSSTNVTINSTSALGTATAGTTAVGNLTTVAFAALGNEPLTLRDSARATVATTVSPTTYSAPVSLAYDGTLQIFKAMTFAAPVTVSSGIGTLHGNNLTVAAGTSFSGAGTVSLSGVQQVNVPIAHAGGVRIAQDSTISFNAVNSFPGALTLRGTLNVNENQSVSRLIVAGGTYNLAAGKTLAISDGVDLIGFQNVSLSLAGAMPVAKYATNTTTVNSLGAAYDGAITIREGTYIVGGATALGSTVGSTTVTGTGRLLVQNGQSVADTVFLDNAAGDGWNGALGWSSVGGVAQPNVITGRVDLGNQGSYIAGGDIGTDLAGPITGGSLTTVSNRVRITTNQAAYTGLTRARNTLALINTGRLATTSEIVLEQYAELTLDNGGTVASTDRVADSIPITMRGGILKLRASNSVSASETVGQVTAARGSSDIVASYYDSASSTYPALLTISNLNRGPAAVVNFLAGSAGNRIFLTAAPTLNDGMMGGWATTGGNFATYDANGVRNLQAFQSDINGGDPAANLQITNSVVNTLGQPNLTADRTINSATMFTNTTFTLNGHTLTVDSGGILSNDSTTITGGTLVGGASSGGELFLYGNIRVEADIPSGAVTVSRFGGVVLAGTNSYTGATTINAGSIGINSAAALAPNNVVDINNGTYLLNYTSATPARLQRVRLRGNGEAQIYSSTVSVNADAYDVEAGWLFARLAGNGPITKTTDGELIMRENNINYSGNIDIQEGTLTIGDAFTSSNNVLGTGTTFIRPNGRMSIANIAQVAHVVLDGGLIQNVASLSGDLSVIRSSRVRSSLGGSYPGTLDVLAGITLDGAFTATGDTHIDGSWTSTDAIVASPASTKRLRGAGRITGNASIAGGGILAPGNSAGKIQVTSAALGAAGVYEWELADASGAAGSGWDLLAVDQDLLIGATPGSPFRIALKTLAGTAPGLAAGFDNTQNYAWTIASAQAIYGFSSPLFTIDTSGFQNALGGGTFDLVATPSSLVLTFTAVPEPASGFAFVLAAASFALRRRR